MKSLSSLKTGKDLSKKIANWCDENRKVPPVNSYFNHGVKIGMDCGMAKGPSQKREASLNCIKRSQGRNRLALEISTYSGLKLSSGCVWLSVNLILFGPPRLGRIQSIATTGPHFVNLILSFDKCRRIFNVLQKQEFLGFCFQRFLCLRCSQQL